MAAVSLYGEPDPQLKEKSWNTLIACEFSRYENVHIINISSILAVVAMVPLPKVNNDEPDRMFVIEKSGLEDVEVTGYVEPIPQEEND